MTPRRLRLVSVLTLCAATACGGSGAKDPAKKPPPKEEPPSSPPPSSAEPAEVLVSRAEPAMVATHAVIIREGAGLYATADAEAPIVTLGEVERPMGRAAERGSLAGHAFELFSEDTNADRLEVRALAAEQSTPCAAAPHGLRRHDVHVFVDKKDIVPVVTQRWLHVWSDESSVLVEPGAEVGEADSGGLRTVDADGIVFKAALPDEAVGLAFDLPEDKTLPSPAGKESVKSLTGGPGFKYAGNRVLKTLAAFETRSAIDLYPKLHLGRAQGGRQPVTAVGNCVQFTGIAPTRLIRLEPRDEAGPWSHQCMDDDCPPVRDGETEITRPTGARDPIEGPMHRLPPGVTLTWPDGSEAGMTHEIVDFWEPGEPADGDRLCFREAAGLGSTVVLCAARADVDDVRWEYGTNREPHPRLGFQMRVAPFVTFAIPPKELEAMGLPKKDVWHALRRRTKDLVACRDEHLVDPEVNPTVTVAVAISEDGVPEVSLSTPSKVEAYDACVVEASELVTFVGAAAGTVHYSFAVVDEAPPPAPAKK